MNRRDLLKGIGVVGLGGGGYVAYQNPEKVREYLPQDVKSVFGPPPTETQIGKTSLDSYGVEGPFNSLIFYESGAAEVFFNTGHDMNKFAITHDSLDVLEDPFQVWEAPTYQGPEVVDLKKVIEKNGPYPSNKFTFGAYYDPSKSFHFSAVPDPVFQVPSEWYTAKK